MVLGVGAVTTAYGLLHQVVLRPLPFHHPDDLVVVRSEMGGELLGVNAPGYHRLRDAAVFSSMAALVEPYLDGRQVWTGLEVPEILHAVRATPDIFRTLGVEAARGPGFSVSDGDAAEVVLSHAFWRDRFAGDPDVVGGSMEINGAPHAVVGILPAEFTFPLEAEPFDVWLAYRPPVGVPAAASSLNLRVVGRPPASRSPEEVRAAALQALEEPGVELARVAPFERFLVGPLKDDLLGPIRRPLFLLLLGAGMVLAVAVVNLALLMAARNLERTQEIRIRAALGAGRARLIRHLLVEATLVAVVAGTLAVLLAALGVNAVVGGGLAELPRVQGEAPGRSMLLFGLALSVVPALVASAIPAFKVSGAPGAPGARRSTGSRSSRRTAAFLAGVEACLVFVLMVGMALAFRSLEKVLEVDPGFDAESAVALQIRTPRGRYETRESFDDFVARLETRVRAVPGVRAAGTITNLPLATASWAGTFAIEGRPLSDDGVTVDWEVVSPGYFQAAGIPLIAGRGFGAEDDADAPLAVIINRTLAERWWPDSDPLGARVTGYGPEGPWQTVVGVVGDVKQQGLEADTRGFLYVPSSQLNPWPERELVVRSSGGDPESLVPAVRAALRELEPGLVVGRVRTLDTLVARASGAFRLRAVLFGTFAALALLLGMAGIYGVAAHSMRSARREIGVRMAVGADGLHVAGRVLRSGLAPVALGVAVGLGATLGTGRFVAAFLFGVSPADPGILAGTALFLLTAGGAAILPTALRARRVDPVELLREE